MDNMSRRRFLTLVGAGSGAIAAAAMIPTNGVLAWKGNTSSFTFRAVAGLPAGPLPAYASYVVQGTVDLRTRSGVITKAVYAGYPDAMSTVAFPGLSRVVRVTDVRDHGGLIHVDGVIDDKRHLVAGETPDVHIQISRDSSTARARFLGTEVLLQLQA